MGLRTRVRLPSAPLDSMITNPNPRIGIGVIRNQCFIEVRMPLDEVTKPEPKALSFKVIRDWVETNHQLKICNSSITMVLQKAGVESLESPGNNVKVPKLKTDKEKAVLDALMHFNVIKDES